MFHFHQIFNVLDIVLIQEVGLKCNSTSCSHHYFVDTGDSPTSNEGGILSAGDEKYERMLWLRVRVFDNIGSWTDIFINATVEAPPDELVLASSSCMFANGILSFGR